MAYRMVQVSDTLRIGTRSDGSFDVEIWSGPREEGGKITDEFIIPRAEAEEIARHILRAV